MTMQHSISFENCTIIVCGTRLLATVMVKYSKRCSASVLSKTYVNGTRLTIFNATTMSRKVMPGVLGKITSIPENYCHFTDNNK